MWDKVKIGPWLLIYRSKASETGMANHQHYDLLHFIASYDDNEILVDSGRASYDSKHIHFDATNSEYHNSVIIDNCQYKPKYSKVFPQEYYDHTFNVTKEVLDNEVTVTLENSGFNRIDENIRFTRKISVTEKSLTVNDFSYSRKKHSIETYFHLSENLLSSNNNNEWHVKKNKVLKYLGPCNMIDEKSISLRSIRYGECIKKYVLYNKSCFDIDKKITHSFKVI